MQRESAPADTEEPEQQLQGDNGDAPVEQQTHRLSAAPSMRRKGSASTRFAGGLSMRRRASAASSEQHAADEEAHLDRHDTDTVLGDADKPWKCVLHCKEAVCSLSCPADAMPQQ